MSIVTRTGDDGTTGLFGASRIGKSHVRLHAVGTVDELNSVLGLAMADSTLPKTLFPTLRRLQNLLFRLGADIATPLSENGNTKRIESAHIKEVERWIIELEPLLPPLSSFTLPGGSNAGATLHLARTVCRRSERWVVDLSSREPITKENIPFLNRLSDYLFLAAREANREAGIADAPVEYGE